MDSTTMPRISFQRRTWLLLVVVVGLILAAPGLRPTPRALAAPAGSVQASKMYAVPTVSKWFPFEISLSATNNHANSYTDIAVQAVFSGPDGARKDVRGFWDGGDIFRVRFTPTREGTWSYTISSTPSDPGLTAVGTLEVIPAAPGDHGFLRRDATYPNHFVFDDGTRHFMFGQTYYEIIRNAIAGESWKTAVDQSVAHGMTKVRLLLYPWPSDTNPYPDTEPFVNSSNHDELNLAHWRKLDEIIVYLRSRGMIADLILFADAGRVFGTLTQDQRYLRYAMARFAAYPNAIWCLTNEWNYTEKDMAYWDGMGEIVRSEDPWMEDDAGLRPLSIHQQTRHDFQFFGSSWPVHATIQDGVRNHDPRLLQGDEWGHYSITVNLGHNLPVANDEYGYIGDQDLTMPRNPDGSYPALTRAKHRNILWGITMAGGYGSAGDIRTFDGSQAIFSSDWHDAVEYDDIRHMVDFWTTHGFEYWRMSPQQSMVISGTRVYACGRASRVYVVYAAEGGTLTLDLPEGPWDLTRFDPRTGEELVLGATPGGGKADFSMPDDRDWVLVLALKSPTFVDVPFSHPYHDDIEALYQAGYTAGCNADPLMYCPENTMNRAESAVFVERGIHSTTYDPLAPASQVFADLPLDSWAAKWVNGLWEDQYTAGCGTSPLIYCPWQGHTRAEGCVFYLRMLNGADYQPPLPSQQTFIDVPLDTWYASWVHAGYDAGLLEPCRTAPELRFCPNDPLTRALAAHMMVQAKNLALP